MTNALPWLIEVKRRTGVLLSSHEAVLLEMALRPCGISYTELYSVLWPANAGDRQRMATTLKTRTARKLADYVEWENFRRVGYRARWKDDTAPSNVETLHEKPHYRRSA